MWALAGKGLWAHKARLTLSVLAVSAGGRVHRWDAAAHRQPDRRHRQARPRRATATVRATSSRGGLRAAGRPAGAAAAPGRGPGCGRQGPGWGAAQARDRQRQAHRWGCRGPRTPRCRPGACRRPTARRRRGRRERRLRARPRRGGRRGSGRHRPGHDRAARSGIVRVNGTDGAGPASLVVFDLATARRLLGVPGYSSVDVLAAPGVLTPGPLASLVRPGGGGRSSPRRPGRQRRGERLSRDRGRGPARLRRSCPGGRLVPDLQHPVDAGRPAGREFGLLRVVGATPRQLGLLVVSEAAVVGAVASLVGAAVGVGAAAGLLAWLASKDLLPPGLAPRGRRSGSPW